MQLLRSYNGGLTWAVFYTFTGALTSLVDTTGYAKIVFAVGVAGHRLKVLDRNAA